MKRIFVLFGIFILSLNSSIANFIENAGQWNSDINFIFKTKNLNISISNNFVLFDHYKIDRSINKKVGQIIKMNFLNHSVDSKVKGLNPQKENNYITYNSSSSIKSQVFEECIIENLYEGIDIRFYSENNLLRYDFIIHKNADISQIKIQFSGQNSTEVSSNSDLIIKSNISDIIHTDLKAYLTQNENNATNNKILSAKFISNSENIISIKCEEYDKTQQLIIDPLVYSSYIGGSDIEEIMDMYVDANGYTYICGYTSSTNYPTKPGAYDQTYNSTVDIFVTKFNQTSNQLVYSTFIGGELEDMGYAIDVDASGNVYVAGTTASILFPIISGAYDESYNNGYDCFVFKLNSTGSALIYSTYIGSSQFDELRSIRVDNTGNTFLCGKTYGSDFPTTSGSYSETFIGGQDIIVFKLNSSGSDLIYSTFLGGTDIDLAHDIDIDASGNSYILGETVSTDFPTTSGACDRSYNGQRDAVITKLNSSGTNLIYSTYLGSDASDFGYDIAIDNGFNAIICGSTLSAEFPVTSGIYDGTYNGASDAFITKLNSSGSSLIASTFLGGSGGDKFKKIICDSQNNCYVSGSTNSDDFPTTSNAPYKTNAGSFDAIFCRLNSDLSTLDYSTYIGGSSDDEAYTADIDNNSNGYIAGYTMSTNFPTSNGAYDESYNSQVDGFVAKFDNLLVPTITIDAIGSTYCAGQSDLLHYSVNLNFNSGNIFTVQLSDSEGNFSSPINIGLTTAISSGTIPIRIPKNSTQGDFYRIRVTSTNPQTSSPDNGNDIKINASPDVQISGEINPCMNEEYTYTSTTSLNTNYSWFVQGGEFVTDSTLSSVNIKWSTETTAILRLIKENTTTGCLDTNTLNLSLIEPPLASIASGPNNVCIADVSEYRAASSNNANNTWEVGGGVLMEGTTVGKAFVLWVQQGEGYIELIKTDEVGCKGRDRKVVTVNPVPFAEILGSSTAIENKLSKYISNHEAGTSNEWEVSGGIIQGNAISDTLTVLWGTKGTGTVQLVKFFTATSCNDTAKLNINITADLPKGNILGLDSVCENSLEEYSTERVNNTSIKWFVGNGIIIGSDNSYAVQVSWNEYGNGWIKYIITDLNNGNKDSSSKAILIRQNPTVVFPKMSDVCLNDEEIELIQATPVGGEYTGNGVLDGYFYPKQAGLGKHILTYNFTDRWGCSNSDFSEIFVFPSPEKPIITIEESSNRILSNYEYGNQWFIDDTLLKNENQQWIEILLKGKYSVQHTDSNGCKSEMSDYAILNINDYKEAISIYPNPADDILMISIPDNSNEVEINIIDIYGRYLFDFNSKISEKGTFSINLSDISTGVYIIKLSFGNEIISKKLIVNR